MKLYFRYLEVFLKSEMQYRASFVMLSIGQFFVIFSTFASVIFLFQKFGSLKGWNLYEVALCFAVIHIAFSISECCARGFDSFSKNVVNGDFDRILVRPRSTIVQVMGSKFEFNRIGRLIQGLCILIWAVSNLSIKWTIFKVITLILMIASGTFIFTGVFILGATLSFWTIQGIEVVNIFTDGGRDLAQYPLNIYKDWARKFFTFILPFGCVNYLPLMFILDRANQNNFLYMITPLYGMIFIIPCIWIWSFGVKHYKSTGS